MKSRFFTTKFLLLVLLLPLLSCLPKKQDEGGKLQRYLQILRHDLASTELKLKTVEPLYDKVKAPPGGKRDEKPQVAEERRRLEMELRLLKRKEASLHTRILRLNKIMGIHQHEGEGAHPATGSHAPNPHDPHAAPAPAAHGDPSKLDALINHEKAHLHAIEAHRQEQMVRARKQSGVKEKPVPKPAAGGH